MELRGGGSSSQLRLHGQRAGVVRGPDKRPNDSDDDASVRARLAKRNQIHTENHFPTLLGRNNVVGGSRHAVRHAANYKDTSLKSLLSKLATKSNGLSKLSTRAQTASKLSTESSTVSKIMTRAGPVDDVPVYADAHAGGITITFEVDKNEERRRNKIKEMGLNNGFTTTNSGSHKIDVVFDTVPKDNDAIAQMGMGTQGILSTWAKYGFEEDPDTKKLREDQKQNLDKYGYNKFVDLLQQYIMKQISEFRLNHGESISMPPLDIIINKTKEGSFEEGPTKYVTPEDEIYHAYEQFSTAIIAAAPSLSEEKLRYATNAIVKSTQSAIMSATGTVLTGRLLPRTVVMPVDQLLSNPYPLAGIDDPRSFFIKYCVEYLCNQKSVSEEDYKTDSIFGGDVYNAIVKRGSNHRYMIGLQFRGKNVPDIADLKEGLRMNAKNNGKVRFFKGDDGKNDLIGVVVVGENAKLSSTDYGDYKEETPHLLLAAACRHHMSEEADRLGPQSSNYDQINKANQGTFKELVARTITEAKMKFLDADQEQELDRVIQETETKSEDIKAYIDSLKRGGYLSVGAKADLVGDIKNGNLIEQLALNHKIKVMKNKSIESNLDEVYDIIDSKSDPMLQIYLANATDGAPYSKRDPYPQRYKEALETILENSYKGSLSALTGPLQEQISAFKVPEDVRGVDLSQFTWYQVYLIAVRMGAYKEIGNNNFVDTSTKEELIKMIQTRIASRDPGVEPAEAVATSPLANISDFPPLDAAPPKESGSKLISVKTYLETPGNSLEKGQKLKWEWPQGTHPNDTRKSANTIVLDANPSTDGTITVEDQSKVKHVSSEELYIINDNEELRKKNYVTSNDKIKITEAKAQKAQKKRKKRSSTDSRPTTTTINPVDAPKKVASEPENPNTPGSPVEKSRAGSASSEPKESGTRPVSPKGRGGGLTVTELKAIINEVKADQSISTELKSYVNAVPLSGKSKEALELIVNGNKDLKQRATEALAEKLKEKVQPKLQRAQEKAEEKATASAVKAFFAKLEKQQTEARRAIKKTNSNRKAGAVARKQAKETSCTKHIDELFQFKPLLNDTLIDSVSAKPWEDRVIDWMNTYTGVNVTSVEDVKAFAKKKNKLADLLKSTPPSKIEYFVALSQVEAEIAQLEDQGEIPETSEELRGFMLDAAYLANELGLKPLIDEVRDYYQQFGLTEGSVAMVVSANGGEITEATYENAMHFLNRAQAPFGEADEAESYEGIPHLNLTLDFPDEEDSDVLNNNTAQVKATLEALGLDKACTENLRDDVWKARIGDELNRKRAERDTPDWVENTKWRQAAAYLITLYQTALKLDFNVLLDPENADVRTEFESKLGDDIPNVGSYRPDDFTLEVLKKIAGKYREGVDRAIADFDRLSHHEAAALYFAGQYPALAETISGYCSRDAETSEHQELESTEEMTETLQVFAQLLAQSAHSDDLKTIVMAYVSGLVSIQIEDLQAVIADPETPKEEREGAATMLTVYTRFLSRLTEPSDDEIDAALKNEIDRLRADYKPSDMEMILNSVAPALKIYFSPDSDVTFKEMTSVELATEDDQTQLHHWVDLFKIEALQTPKYKELEGKIRLVAGKPLTEAEFDTELFNALYALFGPRDICTE